MPVVATTGGIHLSYPKKFRKVVKKCFYVLPYDGLGNGEEICRNRVIVNCRLQVEGNKHGAENKPNIRLKTTPRTGKSRYGM
jgi:hypothetical protein